jgi:deoxyribodipyrimidine photolyase-related protein
MTTFHRHIRAAAPGRDAARQRWIYVAYDQLDTTASLLTSADPAHTVVALVESAAKARRRPYHRQKLALLLSNQRHFACELAERGFAVAWHPTEGSFGHGLRELQQQYGFGQVEVMAPAERELRVDLATAQAAGLPLVLQPNTLWLAGPDDLRTASPDGPPYRMDAFYRVVRRRTGWLMRNGKPEGGKFSFDVDNRQPWRGDPPAPQWPRFAPDAITREVLDLVAGRFPHAFGELDSFAWPCAAHEVEQLWQHAVAHALPYFGPYEDAMAESEPMLFHTGVSPLLNLGRLTPQRLVRDAVGAWQAGRVPIASTEGFVRQVLGWREFVKQVHDASDGFRSVASDGAPNALSAEQPLPPVFWGRAPSGLRCLDGVAAHVHDHGWSHHITRLMVLSNIATLLGVRPRELADWFWVAYVDAYDWVVEPNVLAMGTFGDGGTMTTKPYVSGAAYLHKMGDACGRCQFDATGKDPRRPCPLTPLYWDFLHRNEAVLATNERLRLPLASMRKRGAEAHTHAAQVRERVWAALRAGAVVPSDAAAVTPAAVESAPMG